MEVYIFNFLAAICVVLKWKILYKAYSNFIFMLNHSKVF